VVSDATTTHDAVTIEYAGASRAFYGVSGNATNINGTVTGVNEGHGIAVWENNATKRSAVRGSTASPASSAGAGSFQGGAAALRLAPGTSGTHPSTGKVGDVYGDNTARLWFCTHSSVGTTPAAWRQVAFV
jgi:hypothetical protein